jgi:hypothetical protein
MAGQQSDETLTRGPATSGDETRTGGGLADSPVSVDLTLTSGIPDETLTHVAATWTGNLVEKVGLKIGDVIDGKHEVMAALGRGANGVVQKVRHREWGTELAVRRPLTTCSMGAWEIRSSQLVDGKGSPSCASP